MVSEASQTDDVVRRARGGDAEALAALFEHYRERLRRMVQLRLDRRLSGRVDPSEVLRLAGERARQRIAESAAQPDPTLFLWFRQVTGQALAEIHRTHLAAVCDVRPDVSLYRGPLPDAPSISLAAQLLGQMTTAGEEATRARHKLLLQEALNTMDSVDREVLILRHFERLGNDETALVLGISKSEASHGFIRALKQLRQILASIPGLGTKL